MSKWEKVKLVDVCDFQGGSQPPKEQWINEPKDGYIRMLQIREFTQNRDGKEEYIKISKSIKTCDDTDILIARYGASVGKILSGLSGAYNVAIMKTIPNTQKLNKKYLRMFLLSDIFQNYISHVGSRAAQAGFNKMDLENLSIPLPPLNVQREIAKTLDTTSELLAMRKQQLAELDKLIKSTFHDMFGDPVTNEKGWPKMKLPQLVANSKNSLKRGPFGGALKKEIFVNEGYLVYEQNHALNNDYSFKRYFIDEKNFNKLKDFEVKAGDILISCSGVYLGKLSIVPKGALQGIINQALLKVTLNNKVMNTVFFVNVFSNPIFKHKNITSNRGSGIPNLPPMSVMKNIDFISPPITLQNRFAEIVTKIEEQKVLVKKAIDETQVLFNSLMSEYFE